MYLFYIFRECLSSKYIYLKSYIKVAFFINFLTQTECQLQPQLSALYGMLVNQEFVQKSILFRDINIVNYQGHYKEQ